MTDTELVAALADQVKGVLRVEREFTAQQIADLRADFEALLKSIPEVRHGKDGRDGIDGKDGEDGRDGVDGKNGVDGLTGLDGKDGREGRDGKDGLTREEQIAAIEAAEGRGFEKALASLEILDDGRVVKMGERTFQTAIPLDKGVFREETPYEKGDCVSFGSQLWIAQKATQGERPGEGPTSWRLAVKKGRDGKDAGR